MFKTSRKEAPLTPSRPTEPLRERLICEAVESLSLHINDSCVENDGAGEYVYVELPPKDEVDEPHLIAFLPLEEGASARWTIHINFGVDVVVSDYTITSPIAQVGTWVNQVVADNQ